MIASFAMALRYSFGLVDVADSVEAAIAGVLADGLRTGDIAQPNHKTVGTAEMGDAIIARVAA
jgi:3-isopropylmalate dehydrogenase